MEQWYNSLPERERRNQKMVEEMNRNRKFFKKEPDCVPIVCLGFTTLLIISSAIMYPPIGYTLLAVAGVGVGIGITVYIVKKCKKD
jgi:hypothetical protein